MLHDRMKNRVSDTVVVVLVLYYYCRTVLDFADSLLVVPCV